MQIKCFVNNAFQENSYVLIDEQSHQCVLIDPGMSNDQEWQTMLGFLDDERLTPVAVWLTHCHIDHEMGTGYLTEHYDGLAISGPVDDYACLPAPGMQAQLFGIPCQKEVTPVTHNIKEGDVLHLASTEVRVFDIPGHSHHGLCYYVPEASVLFTGDVLFCGSIGRSDFGPAMGCDGEALVDGIRCKLLALPPQTHVCPGHGPMTTIASEVEHNPYF